MEEVGEVVKEDDEFEVYRKRMMLAYRFRPNPLVGGRGTGHMTFKPCTTTSVGWGLPGPSCRVEGSLAPHPAELSAPSVGRGRAEVCKWRPIITVPDMVILFYVKYVVVAACAPVCPARRS